MKWMKWLVVLVVLLLVASIPATDAWAKGKNGDGDKGKGDCRETPAPSPAAAINHEPGNSLVWFVMDRTNPTHRLAGPFYMEQACRASAVGFSNSMCRAVRD